LAPKGLSGEDVLSKKEKWAKCGGEEGGGWDPQKKKKKKQHPKKKQQPPPPPQKKQKKKKKKQPPPPKKKKKKKKPASGTYEGEMSRTFSIILGQRRKAKKLQAGGRGRRTLEGWKRGKGGGHQRLMPLEGGQGSRRTAYHRHAEKGLWMERTTSGQLHDSNWGQGKEGQERKEEVETIICRTRKPIEQSLSQRKALSYQEPSHLGRGNRTKGGT